MSQTVEVYRLEGPDGKGPYGEVTYNFAPRDIKRNPAPNDSLPPTYFYGVCSMADLRRWFWPKRAEIFWAAMKANGFRLKVYKVPVEAVSHEPEGRQIAFLKSKAKLAAQYRLNESRKRVGWVAEKAGAWDNDNG